MTCPATRTLEDYLRKNIERGVIDHSLRASVDEAGRITFYIHPDSQDGDTCDFRVESDGCFPHGEVLA